MKTKNHYYGIEKKAANWFTIYAFASKAKRDEFVGYINSDKHMLTYKDVQKMLAKGRGLERDHKKNSAYPQPYGTAHMYEIKAVDCDQSYFNSHYPN
jgi:hypothetical protein